MKLNHKDCKHCDSYLKKLISKVTQLELCHRNRRNACVRKSINKQLHKRNLKCGILHHGCNPTHTGTGGTRTGRAVSTPALRRTPRPPFTRRITPGVFWKRWGADKPAFGAGSSVRRLGTFSTVLYYVQRNRFSGSF